MIPLLLIGVLMLTAAAVAMCLRNLVHSALLLIGSWAGVAFFYLWAGAEFVAFAQVLVYVGAVSMVVLFAVLLTRRSREDMAPGPESRLRALAGILVGSSVAGLLIGAILGTPLRISQTAAAGNPAPTFSVRELGTQLAGHHATALLVVGVVLTVALLGAVVIAATDSEKEESR